MDGSSASTSLARSSSAIASSSRGEAEMAASDAFYPIIYVRGYAMRRDEMDDTIADPFCGFNLGSTVFRQTVDKNRQQKFVFESPVIRLRSDFGYEAVYSEGLDIVDPGWSEPISRRSIVIYRYYEAASS